MAFSPPLHRVTVVQSLEKEGLLRLLRVNKRLNSKGDGGILKARLPNELVSPTELCVRRIWFEDWRVFYLSLIL